MRRPPRRPTLFPYTPLFRSERLLLSFDEPGRLPQSRGIAVFACGRAGLFEAIPLPQVHRSRLLVADVPSTRELVALEQEFGTVLVAACDRTGARFFAVTAFGITELPGLTSPATRSVKFHGERQAMRGSIASPSAAESRSGSPTRSKSRSSTGRICSR